MSEKFDCSLDTKAALQTHKLEFCVVDLHAKKSPSMETLTASEQFCPHYKEVHEGITDITATFASSDSVSLCCHIQNKYKEIPEWLANEENHKGFHVSGRPKWYKCCIEEAD